MSVVRLSCRQDAAPGKVKSWQKALQKDLTARAGFDPHWLAGNLAGLWSDWLRAHFATPVVVASVFGVTTQTAYNWWSGTGRPTADKVLIADAVSGGAFTQAVRHAARQRAA